MCRAAYTLLRGARAERHKADRGPVAQRRLEARVGRARDCNQALSAQSSKRYKRHPEGRILRIYFQLIKFAGSGRWHLRKREVGLNTTS